MKKIISIILCITLALGCMSGLSLSVSAESTDERDVHYSDLFYGYFHYLENSPLLKQYYEGTSGTLGRIYTDFYNDGEYAWSKFKTFVDLMGSPATAVAIIAEKAGLGNYTYNNMLDSANVIFAKHLANASEGNELAPTFNKYYTAFKDATNVIADISHELAAIPESSDNYATSVVDAVINAFKEERLLLRIPNAELMKTNQKLVNSMGEIVSAAGEITSVIDAATVYATALSLESVRADIVSDIYQNAPTKSMLKDGMSRLYTDLTNQFSTYFIDNYIVDKVLLDFADEMLGKAGGGAAGIISGVAKVLSFVSFEILRPETVSLDDLMTQVALKTYVDDAYRGLTAQNSVFSAPFKSEQAITYLNALQGLVCAVDAACDATEKIVLDYNKAELETIKRNFYGKDMRAVILNQAVATVKTTPKNELIKTRYGNWQLTESNSSSSYAVRLCGSGDEFESNSIYTPWDGLNANIIITNYISVEVPEGEKPILNGYLKCERTRYLGTGAKITNYGDLTINGYFSASSSNSAAYGSMYNYGTFRVSGNIGLGYHGNYVAYDGSVTYAGNEISVGCSFHNGSTLYYGRDLIVNGNWSTSYQGHIILNGAGKQTLQLVNWPKITIENTSEEGVELYKVNANICFNHNGKPFTATNCTFTDYDGDGVKDDKDATPTVGNPCVITVTTNGSEKGYVSAEKLETYGGAEHTVTATPSPKYEFVQWKNGAGQVLTSNASYTFVAKGDNVLQAVFRKRSQPITVTVSGGKITAPQTAEIESEVNVTYTENEGYIYTEGSLKYNETPIENGKFVMPDEAVTITAEFLRNEHYFALKEKIAEAKKYTFENYSAESFMNLQDEIRRAEEVLLNNVSEEVASEHIIALQNAESELTDKYLVEIIVEEVPELYLGADDLIYSSSVAVYYDNGTMEYTNAFTVENFDCNILGEQDVIFKYGECIFNTTVTVQKRAMFYVLADNIPDQLFVNSSTYSEPELKLTYYYTNDILLLGRDYEVTYSNNNTVGTATATVTGKGIYEGSCDFNFKIYCDHSEGFGIEGICKECESFEIPNINQDGFYELSNVGNLFWFAETVNGGNNVNAMLVCDIDLENKLWTPIGKTGGSEGYKGIFNGNGFSVTGLNVIADSSSAGAGFFGEVRSGTIKDFTISGNVTVTEAIEYVGGVVGSAPGTSTSNGANISGITSYVNVKVAEGVSSVSKIGGFMGYANHATTVERCVWYGTLDVGNAASEGAGGFLGCAHSNTTVIIKNCAAYGNVITNFDGASVGGFLGISATSSSKKAQPTIENCIFASRTDGTNKENITVLGVLNGNETIKNFYYIKGFEAYSQSSVVPSSLQIAEITEEKLFSGEVCDLLNSGSKVWSQKVGTDLYPIICGHKVYNNGICSGCGKYEEPTKNSNGYYELGNAGNLFWFAETVNSGKNTINGILTADIDLANILWIPMGVHNDFDSSVASINFKGTFDGNYHVVKNMTVSVSNANEAGFFGRTNGAKIYNLGIENASVTQSNENRVRAGILGGEIYNSTVSNCYALGTVTTLHDQSGGIAGEAAGGTTITNCYTNFSVLVGGPCTITNNYDSTSATSEMFKNGQVCEFLNNGSENIWGQTVGIDKFPVFAQNATVLGDIDGDKILSATDLVFFKKAFMNDILNSYTGTGADINIDGKIDILDLVCMKNRLLSAE